MTRFWMWWDIVFCGLWLGNIASYDTSAVWRFVFAVGAIVLILAADGKRRELYDPL